MWIAQKTRRGLGPWCIDREVNLDVHAFAFQAIVKVRVITDCDQAMFEGDEGSLW